jgi:hypothetical protein
MKIIKTGRETQAAVVNDFLETAAGECWMVQAGSE